MDPSHAETPRDVGYDVDAPAVAEALLRRLFAGRAFDGEGEPGA